MAAVEVRNLTKTYRIHKRRAGLRGALMGLFSREAVDVPAVREVSFELEEGELVGFLGPNGAGKTTTLKMLSGILFPSSGEARVLGHVPWERSEEYRRRFALVLGQKNQLWWDLPARESLALNRAIYGVPEAEYRRTVGDLAERLGVERLLGVMVRELSLGERMKMELIAALLHSPRVLFLDEPTIGLDVPSQRSIRDFLREYNRRTRTTVLLTSHYMNDIKALCDRVLVIRRGRKVFDGPLSGVVERFSGEKLVTVVFADSKEGREGLERFGRVVERTPNRAVLRVAREEVPRASQGLLGAYEVEDLTIEEVPIEEVIEKVFAEGDLETGEEGMNRES